MSTEASRRPFRTLRRLAREIEHHNQVALNALSQDLWGAAAAALHLASARAAEAERICTTLSWRRDLAA